MRRNTGLNNLMNLAKLLRERNAIDSGIAKIINRPAITGHIGEYIAAEIFDIELEESASKKGLDGYFLSGRFSGCSVNIKWYMVMQNLLDVTPDHLPDYYLVMVGPSTIGTSSRGANYPAGISYIYLFESESLISALTERRVKLGTATSVARYLWDAAEVYPKETNKELVLSDSQKSKLKLFE